MQTLHRRRHHGHAQPRRHQAQGGLQFIGFVHDLEAIARHPEQREHVIGITRARLGRVQDERLVSDIFDVQPLAARQGRGQGQGRDQALGHYHVALDGGVVHHDAPETDIDAARFERLGLLQGGEFGQTDLDVTLGRAQGPDQLRDEAIQGGRHEAHAEPLPLAAAQTPGTFDDFVQSAGELHRLLKKKPARLGQAQMAARTVEQRHPQFLFQLTDLAAQRRLRDMQLFRRAGDVQLLGGRLEITYVAQLHHTSWVCKGINIVLDLEKTQSHTLYTRITLAARGMTPTRITAIETVIVDLPTIRAHQLAMTVMQHQSMVIVRVRSDDGIVGLGEGTTIGGLSYADESPEGIKLTIDTYLAPALIGQDATNVHGAMRRMESVARGNRFAKSAVQTALLDAQGKRLGVPVSTLLGGAVRERLPTLWTLASGDTGRDIEEAEALLEARRHNTFKLKIGRRPVAEDVAHVSRIKAALGDRARVTVDVNQAWSEADAGPGIARLEANGVDLIEQPLPRDQRAGLARLAARFIVPIMADESINTPEDVIELARLGGTDVVALKTSKSGGLYEVLRTAAVADAAGMTLYGGTLLEGSIGTIAAAHAFATLPRLGWGTELFGPLLLTGDIVANPPVYRDFGLELPTGPGLGLELDEDKFDFYRRDRSRRTHAVPSAT